MATVASAVEQIGEVEQRQRWELRINYRGAGRRLKRGMLRAPCKLYGTISSNLGCRGLDTWHGVRICGPSLYTSAIEGLLKAGFLFLVYGIVGAFIYAQLCLVTVCPVTGTLKVVVTVTTTLLPCAEIFSRHDCRVILVWSKFEHAMTINSAVSLRILNYIATLTDALLLLTYISLLYIIYICCICI